VFGIVLCSVLFISYGLLFSGFRVLFVFLILLLFGFVLRFNSVARFCFVVNLLLLVALVWVLVGVFSWFLGCFV